MDKPKEFIESVALVVNEVSNSGFNVVCKPNINNQEVLTFIVYKNTAVEITVKGNGTIRMVFDTKLSTGKVFTKTPYDLKASQEKINCSAIEYGYTEREAFPIDFKLI